MASFSIQAVSERTGLSPHVIRAWERRYGAIEPARSPGKHRLYSEEEIERLSMLQRAVRTGHSIGRIARLPAADLRALSSSHPTIDQRDGSIDLDLGSPFREEAMMAIQHFDNHALHDALKRALITLGHQGLLCLVVGPLSQEIGDRWRSGELTAAHEHFFTSAVKIFLGDVTRQFATPLHAPRLVVVTPLGQQHELGAVMAASAAANLGWRVIYLGVNLPAAEIAGAVARNDAIAVALSIVYPEDDPQVTSELLLLAQYLPAATRVLVGGRAARAYFDTLVRIGALYADSIDRMGEQLDSVRRAHAQLEHKEK